MNEQSQWVETRDVITDLCAKVSAESLDASVGATELWEATMNALSGESPSYAIGLWNIWGALSDMTEDPAKASEWLMLIQRAAREWVNAAKLDTAEAAEAYVDRWLYDELGLPRPA
jgi:hypothetical protein